MLSSCLSVLEHLPQVEYDYNQSDILYCIVEQLLFYAINCYDCH